MGDVKLLTRDTAREEYFYRLGFQDGYKAFRGAPNDVQIAGSLAAVTNNARAQIADTPERYINE